MRAVQMNCALVGIQLHDFSLLHIVHFDDAVVSALMRCVSTAVKLYFSLLLVPRIHINYSFSREKAHRVTAHTLLPVRAASSHCWEHCGFTTEPWLVPNNPIELGRERWGEGCSQQGGNAATHSGRCSASKRHRAWF